MGAYLNNGIIRLFTGNEDFSHERKLEILNEAIHNKISKSFYEVIDGKVYRCSKEKGVEEKKGKAAEEILAVWSTFGMDIPYDYWSKINSVQIISNDWKPKEGKIILQNESFNIEDNDRLSGYKGYLREIYGYGIVRDESIPPLNPEKEFFLDLCNILRKAESNRIILTI